MNNSNLQSFQELIDIMVRLRAEDGCPWDRQQTPESLKTHILEETYELLEAIDSGDPIDICDELGDLLLQVVFQAQIFAENGEFTISDVAKSISDKLKRRHPHIFSDASSENHEQRWEEIKRQERAVRGHSNSLAKRIPATLPALRRATKLAGKCPPSQPHPSLRKAQELLDSLASQRPPTTPQVQSDLQVGRILFHICSFAAATGLDPEDILRRETDRQIAKIDSQNRTQSGDNY